MYQLILISILVQVISNHIIDEASINLGKKFQDSGKIVLPTDQDITLKSGKRYEYPFMALISDQKTQCGGAFIKQDVVLTAAHCMNKDIDYNIKNFKVMLHRFRLDVDLDADNSKPFSIQQVIFHPEYNFNKKSGTPNDIVILKINNNNLKEYLGIDLNNMITLDDGKYSKVGEGAKLLGWGTTYKQLETNKKGKPSLVLKEMNLKLVNEKLCNFVGYKRGYNLCTQGLSMDDIPCKGDSGSPLFHLSEDTTLPVLVGLVSFGDLECKSYSAFVKISAYLDFINEFVELPQYNKSTNGNTITTTTSSVINKSMATLESNVSGSISTILTTSTTIIPTLVPSESKATVTKTAIINETTPTIKPADINTLSSITVTVTEKEPMITSSIVLESMTTFETLSNSKLIPESVTPTSLILSSTEFNSIKVKPTTNTDELSSIQVKSTNTVNESISTFPEMLGDQKELIRTTSIEHEMNKLTPNSSTNRSSDNSKPTSISDDVSIMESSNIVKPTSMSEDILTMKPTSISSNETSNIAQPTSLSEGDPKTESIAIGTELTDVATESSSNLRTNSFNQTPIPTKSSSILKTNGMDDIDIATDISSTLKPSITGLTDTPLKVSSTLKLNDSKLSSIPTEASSSLITKNAETTSIPTKLNSSLKSGDVELIPTPTDVNLTSSKLPSIRVATASESSLPIVPTSTLNSLPSKLYKTNNVSTTSSLPSIAMNTSSIPSLNELEPIVKEVAKNMESNPKMNDNQIKELIQYLLGKYTHSKK